MSTIYISIWYGFDHSFLFLPIAPIDEQKRIVKSFKEKITQIEKPASKAFNECEIAMQKELSLNIISQKLINSSNACDNAMFEFSDLKIPDNIPDELKDNLEKIKKDMKLAYSSKAMAHFALKKYLNNGDINQLTAYKSEYKIAEKRIFSSAA
ncbi:unnamed protein product, partial [marine sediment metagenome]